jgi:isopentenyl diphosphate isomerase/L-lactate dehydrogenase-like FMN-dependent dehydrogenase
LFFIPKFFDPLDVDTSFTIFGVKLKTPVFCSPLSRGSFRMSNDDLVGIARGVGKAGALMMLGIGGSKVLQDAINTGTPVVKMVKPYRNTELIYAKIRDAESRGCVAVGMDIDHFYGALVKNKVFRTEIFGPQKTEELKQLISQTSLPFIIKGVLSIADAEKARQLGASAIVVSNHGRVSLDFTIPSVMALPNIVQSVGNKLTILIDTGFKTGNDVLKALALGAKAVGFANSMLLASAADGSAGVALLIDLITAELQRTMAATGCSNLDAISRSIISPTPMTDWLT